MARPPRPRWLLPALLLLVPALLAGGHALLWRAMAAQLEQGWRDWVALRRAAGWRVEHATPLRGGWPLAATLTLDRLRLEGGEGLLPGGLALATERTVLRVALPRLDRLRVEFRGAHRARIGATDIPFAADLLEAVLPLERGTPPASGELVAERLRLGTPAGGVELRSARLALASSASATEGEAALALELAAQRLDLPAVPQGAAAFGRRVEQLTADLTLSGPVPPGRAPAERAEAWRDGGGTLELRGLTLRWGPVGAQAAATLALDEALQPMGAGTLRVSGAGAALEALAEAGVINRRAASTARTVLPLLSRPTGENGAPEIEVPLTLEDRTLALARIPVARLAPLAWPGR